MSGSLSKSLHSSSFLIKMNMEQEAKAVTPEKQGIGTILGSDCERSKAASLRRTLSADMSSKKWLAQNGFSPMKKIASSEELSLSLDNKDPSSSSSSEGEDDEQDPRLQGQFDIWTSILAQKANKSDVLEGPYVHPLVKKQASSLTEKSLLVCTESLGSETGSEGFSSYPPSETSDVEGLDKEEEEAELPQQTQTVDEEQVRVVKYNSAAAKKLPPARSFPPPLASLSGTDGASLRMRTHRDNGRLVLEAVSMPFLTNNFRAQRQDGRLVLTCLTTATTPSDEEPKNEEVEFEEKFLNFGEGEEEKESEKSDIDDDDDDDDDDDEEEEIGEVVKEAKENGIKEIEILMEEGPRGTSRVTNVHRLALMMNRPIGLANRTSTHGWGNKFNQVVKYGEEDEEEVMKVVEPATLAQSLPPRPGRVARLIPKPSAAVTKTAAAAASLNAYEYYWRPKPTATSALNPTSPPLKSNHFMSKNQKANHEQQQLLVLRGNKGDYLGCKEPRRSLLFGEPYCIATS